jgi:hypothetical protein
MKKLPGSSLLLFCIRKNIYYKEECHLIVSFGYANHSLLPVVKDGPIGQAHVEKWLALIIK